MEAKLRNVSGSSMVLALGVMLAVSILCVSMVSTAFTAPMAANDQHQREQAYLAATSAAHLMNAVFDDKSDGTYPEAMLILEALDKSNLKDNEKTYIEKELSLNLDSLETNALSALNDVLRVNVRFTKTSDGTVKTTISGVRNRGSNTPGYPLTLRFPVYTMVLTCYAVDESGVDVHMEDNPTTQGTFPAGYDIKDAVETLKDKLPQEDMILPEEADDWSYEYEKRDTPETVEDESPTGGGSDESGGGVSEAEPKWTILWKYTWSGEQGNQEKTVASVRLYGNSTPTADMINTFKPGKVDDNPTDPGVDADACKEWELRGWLNYADYDVSETEHTVTINGEFQQRTRRKIVWIEWMNKGESTLRSSEIYLENPDNPSANVPTDPTPNPITNENYSCSFKEWTILGSSESVEDNAIITTKRALYNVTTQTKYDVRWMNGDGTALDERNAVAEQPEPTTEKVPVKISNDLYYPFLYWDDGEINTEDETPVKVYTPIFSEAAQNKHSFVWVDGYGNEIQRLEYGDSYPDTAEERDELESPAYSAYRPNDYYHYNLSGWSEWVNDGNTWTKTAQYGTKPIVDKSYEIRWMKEESGNEILYSKTLSDVVVGGEEPTTEEIPVKVDDVDGGNFYPFTGWDAGTMAWTDTDNPVKIYRPQFSGDAQARYSLIWKDGNGNVIKRLEYGGSFPSSAELADLQDPDITDNPSSYYYPPAHFENDSQEQNNEYYYNKPSREFSEWSDGATEDAVHIKTKTALYGTTIYAAKPYTVKWLDGNGAEISNAMTSVNETELSFSGATPTKPDNGKTHYTFSNWDSGTMNVSDSTNPVKTYKPVFNETTITIVVWLNGDDSVLDSESWDSETEPTTDKTPTKASDDENTYAFSGWDDGVVVDSTKTYTPNFTGTPITTG